MSSKIGKRVMNQAVKLNLTDLNNHLIRSDMGLVVTGTDRFVEQVRELSNVIQKANNDYVPTDETRVFKLKYAWAADVTMVVDGANCTGARHCQYVAHLDRARWPGS